jgi:S1-C subfamily serine protease
MISRMGLKQLFSTLALPGVCMAYPAPKEEEVPDKSSGYLGVEAQNQGKLRDSRPVIVSISAKSPAARSGLRPGDTICDVDGKKLTGAIGLLERIRCCRPGSVVPIVVLRNEERLTFRIRIGFRSDESIDLKPDAVAPSERSTSVRDIGFEEP